MREISLLAQEAGAGAGTGGGVDAAEVAGGVLAAQAGMDLASMRAHAGEAVAMLKLLGNEDRLMLLCQLALQARTVSELEQLTGIAQPTLSQQLGVLRREGLVSTQREGKFIWYQLADARALQLMQVVHQLFCGPAAAHGVQE